MSCNCGMCQKNHSVQEALERLPESERAFWAGIYDDLLNTLLDKEVAEAIIDGSWTDADQIIEATRKRVNERADSSTSK